MSSSTTADVPLAAPSDAPAPVAFFKRSSKGKSSIRKRPATKPPADSDSDSDAYSSSDDSPDKPHTIKKRRKNKSVVTAESSKPTQAAPEEPATKYESTSRSIVSSNDATKQADWYDEEGKEAHLLGRKKQKPGDTDDQEPPSVGGTYKGTAGYGSFIKKSENAPQRAVGPIKAPTNIRTITITDYAPDVCKDYKQTGFCGFGDTCKFLHAREDYAAGWKLDREWEINQKTGKVKGKQEEEEDDEMKELKNIPWACVICKKDYKSPIVTKCNHYFCETCAISRYRKNPACAICGARTDGVFNNAKGLQRKLERKKQREEEKAKAAEEEAD